MPSVADVIVGREMNKRSAVAVALTLALIPLAGSNVNAAESSSELSATFRAGISSHLTTKDTSALAAAKLLVAKGRAPKTGYSRSEFGTSWKDVDGNGCSTRNDVLARDFSNETTTDGCKVSSGDFRDPYSGESFHVSCRVGPGCVSSFDVDHAVPLSDAWQKGAQYWAKSKREAIANDPLNLVVTTAHLNRQKGDSDAATWLPPLRTYWCKYVARQVAVKKKYGVWVTPAEKSKIIAILSKPSCANTKLPTAQTRP